MPPDDLFPEDHIGAQPFYEVGANAGSVPGDSTKVGFTIRNSSNQIEQGFAFLINPQGLTYTLGSRSQMFATKGATYVDDFGPAPSQVTMRQLIASGKVVSGGFYTAREDVQRFLTTIYLPATNGPTRTRKRVFFHDHHFQRGFEQHVYFPANSLSIQRSVDLHNVWLLELTMISLEKYPYAEVEANPTTSSTATTRPYVVPAGMTLQKLARKLAGAKASAAKVNSKLQQILTLNPSLRKTRTDARGRVVKPMKLFVGEQLILPA